MKELIQEIDSLIKQGQAHRARELFLSINFKTLPREFCIEFAQLARRLNLPHHILKILGPYVRPKWVDKNTLPTNREKALYAVGLMRIGVYREAQDMLSGLDADEFPDIELFKAHLHIYQWAYALAIPHIKKYLKKLKDPYQRQVSRLNLAAAYFYCFKYEQFLRLITELESDINPATHPYLYGNMLELKSQYLILSKDYHKASEVLNLAEKMLSQGPEQFLLFVKKWKCIMECFQTEGSQDSLSRLQKLRLSAIEAYDWEVVRELDFYQALICNNKEIFQRVYLGTPSIEYRDKLKRMGKHLFDEKQTVYWYPQFSNRFQPLSQEHTFVACQIPGNPLLADLFKAVSKDIFRPIQLGELFTLIYPNEYYNVESSPFRLYQLIKRLRKWLKQQKIPLTLKLHKKAVSLVALSPCRVLLPLQMKSNSAVEELFKKAQDYFGKNQFTSQEVSEALHISQRTAQRMLREARKKKLISGGISSGYRKMRFAA